MNRATEAHAKMVRARSELVLELPFFAHLAMRLEMRPDTTCRSAWTDGRVLAYNPNYIRALPLSKVKGMQCHEVMHLACLHHTRRQERDHAVWNRACDYAINPILLDAGLDLPSGFLDDPNHHGKGAEAIYAALADVDRETNEYFSNGQQEAFEEVDTNEGATGSSDQAQEGDDEQSESADEQDADGEGATGGTKEDEPDSADTDSDPGMSGEVRDAPGDSGKGDSEQDTSAMEQSWREALAQAASKQREFGDMPGALERLLQETFTPTLPWSQLLWKFLSQTARNDFSWMRPNRRHLHAGLYLPGLHNEELGEMVVVLDTSGSVDETLLNTFVAELTAILEDFDATLTVLACDVKVTLLRRLTRADLPLDFTATGGGGTDFTPPFCFLEEQGIDPTCLVYFTDLNCNQYPPEPAYPVLWVTSNHGFDAPPFGEVVRMENPECT